MDLLKLRDGVVKAIGSPYELAVGEPKSILHGPALSTRRVKRTPQRATPA